MAGKKWYVVIVGKAVGVFGSWLEVAPLVVGVSGAQHQSFPTQEEAIQAFRDEFMKGSVKIVNAGPKSSPGQEYTSAPSTPRRTQSHGTASAFQSNSNSPVRRTTSDLSYVDYRSGVEEKRQGSMCSSPRYASSHSASVRTPSGLGYYPDKLDAVSSPSIKTNGTLTPLGSPKLNFAAEGKHNVNMSPRLSRMQSPDRASRLSPSVGGSNKGYVTATVCDDCAERKALNKCHCCNRIIGGSSPSRSLSNALSDMQVSHRTLYEKQMDPRSPMAKESYIPLMGSGMSFGRPSPSPGKRSETGSALFRGL